MSYFESYGIVEQATSPNCSGGKIERIFKTPKGVAAAIYAMLENNQVYPDGYLDYASCRANGEIGFDKLTLVFSPDKINAGTDSANLVIRSIGEKVTSLRFNYIELPLEDSNNYVVNWNYDLYKAYKATEKADDVSKAKPLIYDTAKSADEIDLPFLLSKTPPAPCKMKLGDDTEAVLYNWLKIESRAKKGKEVFTFPQPVVVEKIYWKRESDAYDNLEKAGRIGWPEKDYGYDGEWLCQPDGVQRENDYYVTVNTWLFAIDWDNDYYDWA